MPNIMGREEYRASEMPSILDLGGSVQDALSAYRSFLETSWQ